MSLSKLTSEPTATATTTEAEQAQQHSVGSAAGLAVAHRIAQADAWKPQWGPQDGQASYYGTSRRGDHGGDGFAWQKMANGQPMNPELMIAAHQHLPLGSRVRVHHGDVSVEVTICDRGPYAKGRILDLSPKAAEALGIVHAGHGAVHLELI